MQISSSFDSCLPIPIIDVIFELMMCSVLFMDSAETLLQSSAIISSYNQFYSILDKSSIFVDTKLYLLQLSKDA